MDRRVLPRPQRVLVVDDVAEIREMWRLWLTFWGFSVQEARNGAEAVAKAIAVPPDLILMDLWMPVLNIGMHMVTSRKLKGARPHMIYQNTFYKGLDLSF